MIFSKIRLKIYCISLIIFFSQVIFAKNYFQQQVNYKIDVKLNDSTHTLHAYETIEYTNHSEDALDFIYSNKMPLQDRTYQIAEAYPSGNIFPVENSPHFKDKIQAKKYLKENQI